MTAIEMRDSLCSVVLLAGLATGTVAHSADANAPSTENVSVEIAGGNAVSEPTSES